MVIVSKFLSQCGIGGEGSLASGPIDLKKITFNWTYYSICETVYVFNKFMCESVLKLLQCENGTSVSKFLC